MRLCFATVWVAGGNAVLVTRDAASVCIVRGSPGDDTDAPATTVPVWDNGIFVGATRGASHFCYPVEPGRHVVLSEALVTAERVVWVYPGERVFVLQEVDGGYYQRRGIGNWRITRGNGVELALVDAQRGDALRRATIQTEVVAVPRAADAPLRRTEIVGVDHD